MLASPQEQAIKAKYEALKPALEERARRLGAATEASSLGHGGGATVARATGLAESPVRLGKQALQSPSTSIDAPRRLRRPGAGRKSRPTQDPQWLQAWDALVEPTTRGDPLSPLRWTGKSTRRVATELGRPGHPVSHSTVGQFLKARPYSVQGPRKTREGAAPPERNAQFAYIHARVKDFPQRSQPVGAVDTQTKALGGDLAPGGRESQPQGTPERVRGHDFLDTPVGKALPYGVYDRTHNCGWGSVGVDHETADCAVATWQQWGQRLGHRMDPQAQQGLIPADGGGRHGSRSRLWKVALPTLSDATGLEVPVCHVPPGTSPWNKIAHRLFCHIPETWRGRPLGSQEVIVNLMAHTTTEAGRRVEAALDPAPSETGKKISDAALAQVNFYPADFHGNAWNYVRR